VLCSWVLYGGTSLWGPRGLLKKSCFDEKSVAMMASQGGALVKASLVYVGVMTRERKWPWTIAVRSTPCNDFDQRTSLSNTLRHDLRSSYPMIFNDTRRHLIIHTSQYAFFLFVLLEIPSEGSSVKDRLGFDSKKKAIIVRGTHRWRMRLMSQTNTGSRLSAEPRMPWIEKWVLPQASWRKGPRT